MRKALTGLLSIVFVLSMFTGCGKKEWIETDFSFYDDKGKEVFFLTKEEDDMYLSDLNEEKGHEYQTNRGVKVGDRATEALKKYDLSGFYYALNPYRSSTEEEDEFDRKLLEKYPDINELVQHWNEEYINSNVYSENTEMFLSASFYVKDGKLYQYELNEKGNPITEYDKIKDSADDDAMMEYLDEQMKIQEYSIVFKVKDEKIVDVNVEKYSLAWRQ